MDCCCLKATASSACIQPPPSREAPRLRPESSTDSEELRSAFGHKLRAFAVDFSRDAETARDRPPSQPVSAKAKSVWDLGKKMFSGSGNGNPVRRALSFSARRLTRAVSIESFSSMDNPSDLKLAPGSATTSTLRLPDAVGASHGTNSAKPKPSCLRGRRRPQEIITDFPAEDVCSLPARKCSPVRSAALACRTAKAPAQVRGKAKACVSSTPHLPVLQVPPLQSEDCSRRGSAGKAGALVCRSASVGKVQQRRQSGGLAASEASSPPKRESLSGSSSVPLLPMLDLSPIYPEDPKWRNKACRAAAYALLRMPDALSPTSNRHLSLPLAGGCGSSCALNAAARDVLTQALASDPALTDARASKHGVQVHAQGHVSWPVSDCMTSGGVVVTKDLHTEARGRKGNAMAKYVVGGDLPFAMGHHNAKAKYVVGDDLSFAMGHHAYRTSMKTFQTTTSTATCSTVPTVRDFSSVSLGLAVRAGRSNGW